MLHPDTQRRLDRLHRISRHMDRAFRIPGTGFRLGWDSILGIIPGVGDLITTLPAAYILYESHRLGAPKSVLARQGVNIAIDTLVGSIPVLGDLFDAGHKANSKNVDLLRAHLHETGRREVISAEDRRTETPQAPRSAPTDRS
ncbi:DUF4112 domain-containing protein [Palleronia caenipelagi]|uniref:DUF4112 domain-containing protein n=1 Tax=Palleronia caenipelagi TaxID=2489174 RepID=A0A547PXQ3_9RHOB|nr:DUF4112 domain-containing protein [Palleronia caenipelagi]TRD18912.1 DUF4112 domain-containing protein [Palleronia caenipelagi]